MKISMVITVLNEEKTIAKLLDSLLLQTKKPDEIVIVDGGSKDKSLEIIKHYQKKDRRIRLLRENCSRARGRNLGVEDARNEIIAMTDAGCVARTDWLEKITEPLIHLGGVHSATPEVSVATSEVGVVAGFYQMTGKNAFEKACSVFLGVKPAKFGSDFLPSTRSITFKKEVWEEVGGFSEKLPDAAEDTLFNYQILKSGFRISRVKEAVVEWGMPTTIFNFYFSIFNYAKGDAKTKIWIFPGKGLASHNIKAIFVILRYFLGLSLIIFGFSQPVIHLLLVILVILYLFRAFRKAGLWGIILQIISDLAVMVGFISGMAEN